MRLAPALPRPAAGPVRRMRLDPVRLVGLPWMLLLAVEIAIQPVRAVRDAEHSDWIALATAGRVFNDGHGGSLYDPAVQTAAQAHLVGTATMAQQGVDLYPYPPLLGWLLRPLAALDVHTGAGAWVAVTSLALVAAGVAAWTLLEQLSAMHRVLLAAACTALLGTIDAVGDGQPMVLCLAAAVVSMVLLERKRPLLAGVVLGVAAMKPQYLWLAMVALAVAEQWRMLAGFILSGSVWLLSAVPLVGVSGVGTWMRGLLSGDATSHQVNGPLGAVAGWVHLPEVAVSALLAVSVAAVLWALREQLRRRPWGSLALGIAAGPLCAPYAWTRDYGFVCLVLLLVARRRPAVALLGAVGMGLAALVDDYGPVGNVEYLLAAALLIGAVTSLATSDTVETSARGGRPPRRGVGTSAALVDHSRALTALSAGRRRPGEASR